VIIAGRAIQGTSGAILPLCFGIVREVAPTRKAPLWIGLLTGGYSVAAGGGYILGGYLADMGEWRHIFAFTAMFAVLSFPFIFFGIPRLTPAAKPKKLDVLGGLLFAPGVAAILYGLHAASGGGLGAPRTWLFLLGGLILVIFWVWYELRVSEPLIDLRLLKNRQVAVGNLCGAVFSLGSGQVALLTMLLLQQPSSTGIGVGLTATVAGLLKLPSNAAAFVAGSLSGWLASRCGGRWAVFGAAVVGAGAWGGLMLAHTEAWQIIVGTLLASFSAAMLLAAVPNLILEGAPLERSSEATGLSVVVRGVASAVGVQCVTTLLATTHVRASGPGPGFPAEQAYVLTFGFIVVTCVALGGSALLATARGRGRSESMHL
jgi:MFS family permease